MNCVDSATAEASGVSKHTTTTPIAPAKIINDFIISPLSLRSAGSGRFCEPLPYQLARDLAPKTDIPLMVNTSIEPCLFYYWSILTRVTFADCFCPTRQRQSLNSEKHPRRSRASSPIFATRRKCSAAVTPHGGVHLEPHIRAIVNRHITLGTLSSDLGTFHF
jgi:hypothetical protein